MLFRSEISSDDLSPEEQAVSGLGANAATTAGQSAQDDEADAAALAEGREEPPQSREDSR